jgi:hypothetical protein
MRTLSSLITVGFSTALAAQCPFDPTISPNDLILCPNEQAVLTTQEYDSYQWYKEGVLIPGADQQTLMVDAFQDGGASFSVEATLDGCTEMSPNALVDGWVFLPPYVIHAGAEALYISGEGISHHCLGDSVWLIFSYSENIQWTNNNADIPGASDDSLLVVTNGSYSASGAPSVCPNYSAQLGVTVNIVFDAPIVPEITLADGELCATPAGVAYAWMLNGAPIGGNTPCLDVTGGGAYAVSVTYDPDCSLPSAPFLITNINEQVVMGRPSVFPVPAKDRVTVQWPDGRTVGAWQLIDVTGRTVTEGNEPTGSTITIDLAGIGTGRYWVRSGHGEPAMITVGR